MVVVRCFLLLISPLEELSQYPGKNRFGGKTKVLPEEQSHGLGNHVLGKKKSRSSIVRESFYVSPPNFSCNEIAGYKNQFPVASSEIRCGVPRHPDVIDR